MATFSTRFLGCKVSYTDARALRERLLADGHVERAEYEQAEIAVVNTCCVTHEAVSKSRQAVSRAARSARKVYVTGCSANLEGAFKGLPENVTVVARPSEETAEFVARDLGAVGCLDDRHERDGRVRAFVKIQDGCSFSCNFCVIPLVRGGTRSRTAAAVLAEIARRVEQGHPEIVLSGVNLGCFRDRAAGYTLADLIREAGETPGLRRLRLSSIEINHLTPDLIAALRETPAAGKHLHVPLQSGDERVLRDMGRRYSAASYLAKVEPLADFNLTTDVIVGFPTETNAAFENTLRLVERARMTKVHVFPYSPRPGTVTAERDTVPGEVKRERSARLRAASHEACLRRWRAKLGREDEVLVDRPGRGYGDDYTPWLVAGEVGTLVRARGQEVTDEGILAA